MFGGKFMPPYKQVNTGDQHGCYTVIGKSKKTGIRNSMKSDVTAAMKQL